MTRNNNTRHVIPGLTRNLLTSALCLAALLLATSCEERFEKLNTNPNQVSGDQMEANNYKVGTKVVSLQSLVVPMQEHQYQFIESLVGGPFGGYIGATVDTWQARWETYNPSIAWRRTTFTDVMTEVYTPYRGIVGQTEDAVAVAFANLFRVATMHRLTDAYGPIPYSNVLETEDVIVEYDSQEQVYTYLFEELDRTIAAFKDNLNTPAAAWSKYDRVYYGDISKWLKYANSLKLRMAMRVSYVQPETTKTKVAEAIADGVILSNADNAYMHPVENKLNLIYNGWNDHRVGADIICYMTGYEDPRLDKMFTRNNPSSDNESDRKYAGVRIGSTVSKKSAFMESYSNMIVTAGDPVLWMNAAEVSFLLAEYELRFGDKDRAKEYYEAGVRLSFEERGAGGAEEYLADATRTPDIYIDPLGSYSADKKMSECTIAWDAAGDEETNLEKIITQKWIAIFPLGNEAWAEYRRTGYPKLLPSPQNLGPDPIDFEHHARRLIYPVEEYNDNGANLAEAAAKLNEENSANGNRGDKMASRVWWDVKPYSQIKQ